MAASRSSSSLLIGYLFYMQFSRYDAEPFGPGYKNGSFEPSGDGEIRTLDPLLARQVLSQLSYTPTVPISVILMGLSGPFPYDEDLLTLIRSVH